MEVQRATLEKSKVHGPDAGAGSADDASRRQQGRVWRHCGLLKMQAEA